MQRTAMQCALVSVRFLAVLVNAESPTSILSALTSVIPPAYTHRSPGSYVNHLTDDHSGYRSESAPAAALDRGPLRSMQRYRCPRRWDRRWHPDPDFGQAYRKRPCGVSGL